MQTFLDQPEATFYHVTTIENWEQIKLNGLNSKKGEIFVSRVGELPVLLAIAFEQLPEIYTSEKIVFLKFPQAKINILQTEIISDNQANEWTQPFQNIICRKHIPIENIELMMIIKLGQEQHRECVINQLTQIASTGQENYLNHSITDRSNQLDY